MKNTLNCILKHYKNNNNIIKNKIILNNKKISKHRFDNYKIQEKPLLN